MSHDNVRDFGRRKQGSQVIDGLSALKESVSAWRNGKALRNEPIPRHFWEMAFALEGRYSRKAIVSALRVPMSRYLQERQALGEVDVHISDDGIDEMDFCKADCEPAIPLVSKTAEAFTTKTSVVELYRPDGMLMKIHLCTDRFEELLRAFFRG
ncbi:TPA: hypothetical protein F7Z60_15990 [Legionella pneumophila]|nr:hypothetical protein [Legionella pneumophila]HAU3959235.1 hypothetical protein [Legionella pneumophila]